MDNIKDFKDREIFYKQEIQRLMNIINLQEKVIASQKNTIELIERMYKGDLKSIEKWLEKTKKELKI